MRQRRCDRADAWSLWCRADAWRFRCCTDTRRVRRRSRRESVRGCADDRRGVDALRRGAVDAECVRCGAVRRRWVIRRFHAGAKWRDVRFIDAGYRRWFVRRFRTLDARDRRRLVWRERGERFWRAEARWWFIRCRAFDARDRWRTLRCERRCLYARGGWRLIRCLCSGHWRRLVWCRRFCSHAGRRLVRRCVLRGGDARVRWFRGIFGDTYSRIGPGGIWRVVRRVGGASVDARRRPLWRGGASRRRRFVWRVGARGRSVSRRWFIRCA
jgi:hypothetical protein